MLKSKEKVSRVRIEQVSRRSTAQYATLRPEGNCQGGIAL